VFEDVDIADKPAPAPQKKKGLFSRITDSSDHSSERPSSADGKGSSWHHFGGRKRGQSGQGSELGAMPKREGTPKMESQLKKEHPKPVQEQVKAGAEAPKAAAAPAAKPVETNSKLEEVQDGLQAVNLDDNKTEVKKDSPQPQSSKAAPDPEALKALKPQNSQALEIKVDS
jgi:hypothetical protein